MAEKEQVKCDEFTVRSRVEEIYKIVLMGANFVDIRQYASRKGWGVCDRQLRRYYKKCEMLLSRMREKSYEKNMDRHIAQRQFLYAQTMGAAQYQTALGVLRDEAKLLNLYPPEKVVLAENGQAEIETLSDQDLEQIATTAEPQPEPTPESGQGVACPPESPPLA